VVDRRAANAGADTGANANAAAGPQPSLVFLVFVCAASALGGFLFGLDAVVISGTITPVKAQFGLSSLMEGLFVAASLMGCAIGAFAAGGLADRHGRRRNLMLAAIIVLIGVCVCSVGSSSSGLIASRFAGGVGIGIASMICPLYIAELAPARLRGRLISLYQLAITIGIVAALGSNAVVLQVWDAALRPSALLQALHLDAAWRVMFAVQMVPAAAFVLLCLALPESPRWLLQRGRVAEAAVILRRLVPAREAADVIAGMAAGQVPETYAGLLKPAYRRPLSIAVVLAVLSELSGITVVFYYGPLLLASAGATELAAVGGFALLGVVNMISTLLAVWLIDRIGRRPLPLIGEPQPPLALLVVLICVFVALFACSIGPIKFVIAAEIFPAAARPQGAAITVTMVWVTGAVINQLFPLVRDSFGPGVVFAAFALALLGQFVFVLRRVPETAGQSLETIGERWQAGG
jgi:MFS transporter, SP family, arabinose:H+ symporter